MKLLSIFILKSIRFFIAVVVITGGQAVIADNIIYEGVSVPGGFYLGMSQDEVNQIGGRYLAYGDADSRDCRTGNKCTLLTKGGYVVDFIFVNKRVTQLEIRGALFGGRDQRQLETPVGATQRMSPEEVAALYPGSVINDAGSRRKNVVVANKGYTFKSRLQCPYSSTAPCTYWANHIIYKPTTGLVNLFDFLYTRLSGERGSQRVYKITVPSGKSNLSVSMYGGSGDADLYVKKGSIPTLRSYNCRPYKDGNRESCRLRLGAGIYYIMVRGYAAYSGLSIRARTQ